MKSFHKTAEKAIVKASEAYIKYSLWGCASFFYQSPVPDKVKERFGKKDK